MSCVFRARRIFQDGSRFIVIDNDYAYGGPYDLAVGSNTNGSLALDWETVSKEGALWSGVFNAGSITTALPFAYSRLTPVKSARITIATRCWCVSAIAGRFVGCQPNNNSDRNPGLDLDLGAELDHLLGRHAEEGGGAFGVALQEGKKRFPP